MFKYLAAILGLSLIATLAAADTIPLPSVSWGSPTTALALAPWSAEIHQNGGGSNYGHYLMWADQNSDIVADHFTMQTTDQSVSIGMTLTGTPTTGEKPGITTTVNGVGYSILYTIQASDTTLALIATGLANCLSSSPGGNCTVTPSTFTSALLALTYQTQPSATGAVIGLDMPGILATTWTAINTAHITITTNTPATANLDNGPYYSAGRYVVNRTPTVNDAIGWYRVDGQSTSTSNLDTQYGGMKVRIGAVSASSPEGTVSLESSGNSKKASAPVLSCQNSLGCWIDDGTVSNPNRANSFGVPGSFGIQGPLYARTNTSTTAFDLTSTQSLAQGKITGASQTIIMGVTGTTPFIQSGSTVPVQIQKNGGSLGALTSAAYTITDASGIPLTVTATGANDNEMIANAAAGQLVYWQFQKAGVNKFVVELDNSNNFAIYDNVNAYNAFSANAGGGVTIAGTAASLDKNGGLYLGAPTGSGKGLGTANFAGAIYANGTIGATCTVNVPAHITVVGGIVTLCN